MVNIADIVVKIRNAVLGKEIRGSIADGIETINAEVVSTTSRQSQVEDRQDAVEIRQDLIDSNEATRVSNESGRVLAEVVRVSEFDDIKTDYDAYKNVMIAESNVAELQSQINENVASLAHIAINVKNFGAKGDGIANDTLAFQNALLMLATGGTLLIPTGTYLIYDALYVPSNTKVLGNGKAILKRNSDTNALMLTKSEGTIGGYNACKNVTIENITFDGSQSNFQPNCTLFASGHASNVVVKGCTFQNLDGWHMIELNATKDSIITECIFDTYGYGNNGATATEMLQLDFASAIGPFPWYGPYDNTQCKNIVIEKNVFRNSMLKAIGNHTFLTGVMLKDIYIKNNKFESIVSVAISLDDIDGFYVLNNRFTVMRYGIIITNQQNANKNILIEGNHYEGNRLDAYISDEGRFIGINVSGRNGFETVKVRIINNIILNCNTHAIGFTASDVIIEGNHITSSYSNGIYLYGGYNVVISNNIIYNNYISAVSTRADLVIGNNGSDISSQIVVTGNRIGILIVGSNIANTFIQGNSITTITPGTAIVKSNVVNGVYVL